MLYQEFVPIPALQPYIDKLWILETHPTDPYPLEHLITPNGAEGLILSYQQPAQSFFLNDQHIALPEAYLLIQPHKPWTVITTGCSGIIGVFFKAGSLHKLLKTTMTEVVGQVIEPQAFLGNKPIRCLLGQLAESALLLRIALVEKFFHQYFASVPTSLDTVQYAVHLIGQYEGSANIELLAHRMGISRRAIHKQFVQKVGLTPKYYSRMMRFTGVQRFLKNYPQTSWLDLTHQFGYYDQSHLIKDFHDFTGTSPLGYAALDTFLVECFITPEANRNNF